MKLYNNLTDKLEEFIPIKEGTVTMYVCGPTVYNYVHIGNMRPVITFDVLSNYLSYLGYDVKYASNFTDINPKITEKAKEMNISEREVAQIFSAAYLNDVKNYNCDAKVIRPTVIENLDNIFEFISKLIKNGYAYVSNDDVYFRVSSIKDYGILSKQKPDDLIAGSRVEINDNKENPLDFALWRHTTEGERFNSPWGEGIPGWHTECVVMINSLFGEKIDIHGGGMDLKFPHHEDEIAQSMALNGNHLANFWLHNGFINIDGDKMSKSLNNFVLAKDFINKYSANVIKLVMYKTHYRLPINFTDDAFKEAKVTDEKILLTLKQARLLMKVNNYSQSITNDIEINKCLDDDLNTPNLLAYLSSLVKEVNIAIRNNVDLSLNYSKIILILKILGLKYDFPKITEDDLNLYKEWNELREKKDFTTADTIRKQLVEKGIL